MTAKQFLMAHNQSTHDIDCNAMLNDYLQQMKMGLSGQGSIPMIPTYLTDIDRSKIKGGKRILIDAGGTNFRSALGYFDEEGNVVLEKLQKTIMPASDRYLTKEEFYAQIASNIAYLAEEGDNVGFCFSYQVDMDRDVDGVVVNFSKEVKAPQVVGTRVGKETLFALKAHSDKNRGIVILNDTVATLLGGMASSKKQYSAYVGYIYGTGTNLCYIEDTANIAKVANLPQGKMLINTESGNYNGFAQGDFDKFVANATANPNGGLLEKMSSGKYLSDVIYQAFVQAQREGLFVENVEIAPFATRDVSDFVVGKGVLNDLFTNQADKQFAMDICVDLIDRAAKIGAIINSGAVVASCTDKALPAAIVAEGTTFNKLVGFRSNFEKYLTQILGERGISYEIIQGEELNLVGTLMATMVLN